VPQDLDKALSEAFRNGLNIAMLITEREKTAPLLKGVSYAARVRCPSTSHPVVSLPDHRSAMRISLSVRQTEL
jgi:hypothetical protein